MHRDAHTPSKTTDYLKVREKSEGQYKISSNISSCPLGQIRVYINIKLSYFREYNLDNSSTIQIYGCFSKLCVE